MASIETEKTKLVRTNDFIDVTPRKFLQSLKRTIAVKRDYLINPVDESGNQGTSASLKIL
jgi:hypothetical protein